MPSTVLSSCCRCYCRDPALRKRRQCRQATKLLHLRKPQELTCAAGCRCPGRSIDRSTGWRVIQISTSTRARACCSGQRCHLRRGVEVTGIGSFSSRQCVAINTCSYTSDVPKIRKHLARGSHGRADHGCWVRRGRKCKIIVDITIGAFVRTDSHRGAMWGGKSSGCRKLCGRVNFSHASAARTLRTSGTRRSSVTSGVLSAHRSMRAK